MNHRLYETINCPNCRASDSTDWGKENGFVAVQCNCCGLVYVNPRPREDVISEANKIGVHQGDAGALNVTARRIPSKIGYYSRVLREMFEHERSAGTPLKWLDVGAGYGEFVQAVLATMPAGTEAVGLEPMAPKVKVARSLGLPIESRDLGEISEKFDVISLINVYSHIPDFDSFAAILIEKLKPGGILFMETGNIAALRRDQFPDILYLPDHLVFSSPRQMRMIIDRLGMNILSYREVPIDNLVWSIKTFIKGMIRRRLDVKIPGKSKYRTVFYKIRRK